MHAGHLTLVCSVALALACGRSVRDSPNGEPSAGGAGGNHGGTAGTSAGVSGAASGSAGTEAGGTSSGGTSTIERGGSSGAITSGGSAGGDGGTVALCEGHEGFISIVGELPGYGSDLSFRAGCPSSLAPYSGAASYTGGPGEGSGTWVTVIACNADGSRELRIYLTYDWNRTDAGSTSELEQATLQYTIGQMHPTVPITTLSETRKPVAEWAGVSGRSSEGIGMIYEGTFVAEGDANGTAARVMGSFSVCHVANLGRS